jgi:hypothetical protein
MKTFLLSILLAGLLLTIGCRTSTEVKKDEHAEHSNKETTVKPTENLTADFTTNPAEVKAGEKVEIMFAIKNPSGEVVRDLQIVHEKVVHLLIVSDDLAEFYHEHPEQQADGSFKTSFTFKNGGVFKLYADFTPKNGQPTVKSFNLAVSGNDRPRAETAFDEKLEQTVDDLFVTLKSDGQISAGKDVRIDFQVFDAKSKKPVTDLENYLGAKAHLVVISRDLSQFVHAHPISHDNAKGEHQHGANGHETKLAGPEAESIVSASVRFPQPGLYKIFAQFQRNGKVSTAAFVVNVKNEDGTAVDLKPVEVPKDAIRITVTRDGFVPGEISLVKGKFTKLAFYRAEKEGCGDEVVFKSLNIKKKLPVGEVVIVDLPKDFSGELGFTCGMNMYKGKIIVQ